MTERRNEKTTNTTSQRLKDRTAKRKDDKYNQPTTKGQDDERKRRQNNQPTTRWEDDERKRQIQPVYDERTGDEKYNQLWQENKTIRWPGDNRNGYPLISDLFRSVFVCLPFCSSFRADVSCDLLTDHYKDICITIIWYQNFNIANTDCIWE